MPGIGLTLVTGPANSGRAGEIMRAYRARLPERSILVVPALSDVDRALHELAAAGAVFGTNVVRFSRLFDTIAERCGAPPARPASALQRDVLIERAIGRARLRALRGSSRQPGFARAALRFVRELERSMVEPEELDGALRRWAGRPGHAREATAIYRGYREALEEAGLLDEELFAWSALEALRERPDRFGATPVFVYGFDDFTPLERETLEALASRAAAPVTVSLPYERARPAFRAIAPLFERLRAIADRHVELAGSDEHYAPAAREALSHLERRLYEPAEAAVATGGAVRLQLAGGERAEVELTGAEVLRLMREGTAAGDIVVVFRDPARYASLVEQVFGAYGIPFSLDRRLPLAHTALGKGILALLRCATSEGTADDLIAYLRTPGVVERPRFVDRLEAEVRRAGITTAAQARRKWEERRRRLEEIDRLRRARHGAALVGELSAALDDLFARAYRRRAPVFDDAQLDDPRVASAAKGALAELHALAERAIAGRLDAQRLHDKLARLPVSTGEGPLPDRVSIASPEGVRARRYAAVFVCGLQAGEFPRTPLAEPFLSDADRRALAAASGLVLPTRDDELERERHLFYVCASRAERTLTLSSRFSDENGNPALRSFLVDDVAELFDPSLERDAARRSLSDVTWDAAAAPTAAEWRRATASAGPRHEPAAPDRLANAEVLAEIGGDGRSYSAAALESYADCPVKWLVERVLRPSELEPDPEPLVRGSYAHDVLEQTYRQLREESGSARVTRRSLPAAERILIDALAAKAPRYRISPKETRFRTAVRKLEFDLLRHLAREADAGGDYEPDRLELSFGMDGSELPPLRLEPEGVSILGRIDRVDVSGEEAVVRDYKTGRTAYPVARWQEDHRLQVALYMLAVRELLGLVPVAGLYVPLAGPKPRPRGLVRGDRTAEVGGDLVARDTRTDAEVEDELTRARARVGELAARMRAGEMSPCPERCAWNGGCSYPSICRLDPPAGR